MQVPKKAPHNQLPSKPSFTNDNMHTSGIGIAVSGEISKTELIEYELEDPEFDMSDMDESVMNSSFRGNREGEDSIANRPADRTSKNKNLHIFQNISSENVPGGQHNNSNSFNKDSIIN